MPQGEVNNYESGDDYVLEFLGYRFAFGADDFRERVMGAAVKLDLIADSGASVAHCPQPFARYGLAMDHVGRYRARGVNVGLGTDCAPHNLVEEMRLAIHAGRLMSEDIPGQALRELIGTRPAARSGSD